MWAQVTAISVFTFGACTVVAYVIVPVFFFVELVFFFGSISIGGGVRLLCRYVHSQN
jgi:hypothetical protein